MFRIFNNGSINIVDPMVALMAGLVDKFLRTFARRGKTIVLVYDHGIEHGPTDFLETLTQPTLSTYLGWLGSLGSMTWSSRGCFREVLRR